MPNNNLSPGKRFLRTFVITIGIIIVFAYGFQVTQINLEEPKKPRRQEQLVNVMRSLARPDLLELETERLEIEAPIYIPCPSTQFTLPDLSQPGAPSIKLSQQCAEPGSEITVTGTGFEPAEQVYIYFVPYVENPKDEVELKLAEGVVVADAQGNFTETVTLKKGRTSEEPQKVRAVLNRYQGSFQPSETTYQTIDKIIETIFLALIATTLGTILSVPISFIAARNLMIQVTSLFGSFVTVVAVAPIGWFVGSWIFQTLGGWGVNLIVAGDVPAATALWAPALLFLAVQAVGPRSSGSRWAAIARGYGLGLLGAVVVALLLGLLAGLGLRVGLGLQEALKVFGFLGNFVYVISDAVAIFLPLIGGLAGLFAFVSLAGQASEKFLHHRGDSLPAKVFTVIMAVLAGLVIMGLPASFIAWLYELKTIYSSIVLPALIGGAVMGIIAFVVKPGYAVPTGLVIYYISRTILNILRAIEPLIMAIVFVVWVGIGPFAGVMALTLHTIAALGKLYSEQVENISQGPIEAVTATGANRLQTIIYAVMPQIVPPYIAFTIYRWDINVRMSTIIGFAGGGGIGFLLQQNLNLLKYRQASVQMIAIAIVVSSLDFISAKIRERIV